MYIVDIIDKKRNNFALTKDEINYVVSGYLNDEIKDYQMSSLLMAICINGLDSEETCNLTEAMLNSGTIIDLSNIPGVKVDKHSTGGVGDKTTLIVAPLVASVGVPVAKMSGRSLGYTGGTIDKLESIPGYNVNISIDNIIKQVNEIGVCLSTTNSDLAPADKKIYALRDVTGTVSSKSLIAASIMSKKLATGADKIFLDVKYGKGAFINNVNDAMDLASLMVYIGNNHGKQTKALITNMDAPLGNMVGNALEIKEAIDVLNNKGNKDLRDLCIVISSYMVSMSKNISFKEAQSLIVDSLKTGKAYKKFLELVKYQGGDLSKTVISNKYIDVTSNKKGYINNIDAHEIAKGSLNLGAGKKNKDDVIDTSVGIVLLKNIGDSVELNEPIARIYMNKHKININDVLNAFTIEDVKSEKIPLIYGLIQ